MHESEKSNARPVSRRYMANESIVRQATTSASLNYTRTKPNYLTDFSAVVRFVFPYYSMYIKSMISHTHDDWHMFSLKINVNVVTVYPYVVYTSIAICQNETVFCFFSLSHSLWFSNQMHLFVCWFVSWLLTLPPIESHHWSDGVNQHKKITKTNRIESKRRNSNKM